MAVHRHKVNLAPVMAAANRYAAAHTNKVFEGTIPVLSSDPDEQELLDAAHAGIAEDLERTENALRRAVESLVERELLAYKRSLLRRAGFTTQ